MKIIDIINMIGHTTDEEVGECLFAIVGPLRTWHFGHLPTIQQELAGIGAWSKRFGPVNVENFNRFMEECPNLIQIDIPDQCLSQWANNDDRQKHTLNLFQNN